jgi:uncharacterized protein YeaO (DUF488 family)
MASFEIFVRRAYDPPSKGDGARYLVDRIWPRGVKREELALTGWLKDAAPSTTLRKWFGHDPALWNEFKLNYFAELDQHPEAWHALFTAAQQETITLVYGARDTEYNNAVALKEYLIQKMQAPTIR